MPRFLAVSVLLFAPLAAYDPVAELEVEATLTPEAFAGYTDALPAQVVLGWDFAEPEDNLVTPDGFYQLGILCEAPVETETYLFHDSYVGCSDTSTVSAWVAPLVTAEGEEVVCGPAAADAYGFVDAEFDGGAVWAEATANPDIGKSACDASITETLSLDLVAPAVE